MLVPPFFIDAEGGQKVNIIEEIEAVRTLITTLRNWDRLIEEKRQNAMWGTGFYFDEIKVKTTPKQDKIENAVISIEELEAQKADLIEQYLEAKESVMQTIEAHASTADRSIIHQYLCGFELSEMRLERGKNAKNVLDRVLKRLQATIEKEGAKKR